MLKMVRDKLLNFTRASQQHATDVEPLFHVDLFDNKFDVPMLLADITRSAKSVQALFGGSWASDLKVLSKKISDLVPDWEPKRETLLTEDELCLQLWRNTTGYQQLGPLSQEVKGSLRLLKVLHQDGQGFHVDAETMTHSKANHKKCMWHLFA